MRSIETHGNLHIWPAGGWAGRRTSVEFLDLFLAVVSGDCSVNNSPSHHFTDKEDVIPTASPIAAQAAENPKQLI